MFMRLSRTMGIPRMKFLDLCSSKCVFDVNRMSFQLSFFFHPSTIKASSSKARYLPEDLVSA